jgi:hypothetical protein
MRIWIGGAAAVLLGLACAGCDGGVSSAKASAAAQAAPITAVGCPKTPQPACVTVTADGKTWDVTSAGVDVKRGVAVSVTGTPGPAGACGTTLTSATVDYTGLACGS